MTRLKMYVIYVSIITSKSWTYAYVGRSSNNCFWTTLFKVQHL